MRVELARIVSLRGHSVRKTKPSASGVEDELREVIRMGETEMAVSGDVSLSTVLSRRSSAVPLALLRHPTPIHVFSVLSS